MCRPAELRQGSTNVAEAGRSDEAGCADLQKRGMRGKKSAGRPAEERHERQEVGGQRLHVQCHLHVQHIVGEQVMTQQLHPLGLLQRRGDGGSLLRDVGYLQSWHAC